MTQTADTMSPGVVPPGVRIYAIGDIHGQYPLLQAMHRAIRRDAATGAADRVVVIHLGDYIDRGGRSSDVVELLSNDPLPDFETVYLRGNHEAMLLAGFEDTSAAMGWLVNGGEATLQSYGVCIAHGLRPGEPMNSTSHLLRHILPEHHLSFFRELRPYHIEGGYLFVHAGIRPGVPLVEQTTQDLFWIREDFIDCDMPLPFVVVHGHTPTEQPELRPNRIGVDTGAFNSGVLSAVVLEGRSRRLLSVNGRTV